MLREAFHDACECVSILHLVSRLDDVKGDEQLAERITNASDDLRSSLAQILKLWREAHITTAVAADAIRMACDATRARTRAA